MPNGKRTIKIPRTQGVSPCGLRHLLTHIDEVVVVPRYEVAEGRQLVGHVEDMLPGGIASTNPNRLQLAQHRQKYSGLGED